MALVCIAVSYAVSCAVLFVGSLGKLRRVSTSPTFIVGMLMVKPQHARFAPIMEKFRDRLQAEKSDEKEIVG